MDLPANTDFGHYRIVSALGAGGMGVVYRARDTRLEREVAVKVLPDALTTDPAARARLNREAQAASALNHPNICTIYEVGEAGGHAYIAMEYVEGRSLASMIPTEGLPLESVIRYGEQMADALAHAHDRNVLHRDLKSANVIVTREGRVKILDFGLAKRIGAEIDAATLSQVSPLTQAGAIAGTLHYLPPEVLRGDAADARSDIWSLGVVLYEMASGALPFQGRTSFEVTSAILRESLAQMPARVPPGLRAVIQRCLAKEPGQRYQRASEVRAALEAIGSAGSSPALVAPALAATQARPTRSKWLRGYRLWLAVALVAATATALKFAQPRFLQPRNAPASAVVGPVSVEPRLSNGGKPSTVLEANEYFERAELFMGLGVMDLAQARKMYERALEIDPKFAEARASVGFVDILTVIQGVSNDPNWFYKGQQEFFEALRIDPDCSLAHSSLAAVYLLQGKKELVPVEAERARKANPANVDANHWMMQYHLVNEETAEAERNARETLGAKPTFWPSRMILGELLRQRGDIAGAIREQNKVLEQDAFSVDGLRYLARAYMDHGELKLARQALERGRPADRQNYLLRGAWALLLAREGKRKDALKEMDAEVLKYSQTSLFETLTAAEFYAVLGDASKALEWLDRAVRNGDERTEWFKRNPLLANIQQHPRFKQIIESVEFRRRQRK